MKKFYVTLAGLAIAVGSITLFHFMGANSQAALPRDCDNNSIIYCGGVTASELATRYSQNATGDLDNIYNNYGLSSYDMTNAGTAAKMGEVHKDGRVTVAGQTVATEAQSIGRQNIFPGAHTRVIDGKTYYEHDPAHTFVPEMIVAYVFFDANGDFKAAVLTSCGNPVSAKKPVYKCDSLTKTKIDRTKYGFNAAATASNGATIVSYTYDFGDGQKSTIAAATTDHTYAKPGTYTVKLSVNMKVNGTDKVVTAPQCQVQVVVETPPPTPVYTCDKLTAKKISRLEYAFTGKATTEGGATIVDYVFDFGDGSTKTTTNPTDMKHTYAKPGTYKAKFLVTVKVDGQNKVATGEQCTTEIVVTPPEECKPGIPVGDARCNECKPGIPENDARCNPPVELPKTGPGDIIGGTIGLGSMIAAAYYWHASRRGLLAEFLKR